MNKAKAMLDALMGPNRDADPSHKSEDWKDKRVCRHFLVGLCPHDKANLGGRRSIEACTKIHNEILRNSFNAHADGGPDSKFRRECEAALQDDIKALISKKDTYAKEQLSLKNAELKIRTTGPNPEVGRMKREAMEYKDKADALPADEVAEKEQLMESHKKAMEEYEAFRNDFEKKLETSQKAQTCKVCGLAYSTDEEYEAHAQRKMHAVYLQIQQKMEELDKKQCDWEEKRKTDREKKKAGREEKKSRSRDRKKAKGGERSKSRADKVDDAKDDDSKDGKDADKNSKSKDKKKADDVKDDDGKDGKDAKKRSSSKDKKKNDEAKDDDGKSGKKAKKRSSSRDRKKSKVDSRSRSRGKKRRDRSRSRDRRRSRSRSRDRKRSRSRR